MLSNAWSIVKETASEFVDDDATTLGAALAFYTALAMSPLVVLLLWLATFAGASTRDQLVHQIEGLVGAQGGAAVRAIVENAQSQPGLGNVAGIVSLATLLFSVSGVFGQLQYALDQLWEVKPKPGAGRSWLWLRKRLLSVGTFVSIAFLLVVSLAATAAVSAAAAGARDALPGADVAWRIATYGASFLVTAAVFALMFKVLPDVDVRWRDVVVGGIATAVLFAAGRVLIGLYLGRSSVGSAYGAAGSLIVLLLWVYYASLVLFAGAELTQVLTRRFGDRMEPEAHAIRVEEREEPKPEQARA